MERRASREQLFRFAEFEVDPRAGELRRLGVKIRLQEQPLQVLAMLLEHPGEVVTREELQQKVWPADTFVDSENGLNKAINKLRGALGDSAETPRFVETLPRHGYRFIAPVDRVAERQKRPPNNLPAQLTSFIGRELEMAEIRNLLSTTRLVTLTGPGGVGKTRLGLHVAAQTLQDFPNGVWLVELAPLSDPALVPKAIASALDVPEQPGRQLTQTLAASLHARHLLLLLDNCEHVLSACQDLISNLLRACPNLEIVATSREVLGVEGEATYRVPSLRLPDLARLPPLATLAECESIRLFVERAALSQSAFTLTAKTGPAVAQICHRLDGIPLAIEFAAARVKVLSVDQIAARLDDRFRLLTAGTRKTVPRHQTLRAVMDWSHNLLSEPERTGLRRLSVFAGGWTLEAAEAVCSGNDVEPADVLDLLTHLVDKSLVVVETQNGEARYRLLETVRQYGRDRLQESGEVHKVRSRHRDWYSALAEQAAPELWGPRQALWLERLESEHDNLRAALEWSLTEKDGAEAGLKLTGALHFFWVRHGHWSEGRGWTERALARSAEVSLSALLKALHGATNFAFKQGDYLQARTLGEKGLRYCRELGNEETSAWFLFRLAQVACMQEEYERASALLEESLNLTNERTLTSLVPGTLGMVAWRQGDYDKATALYTKSLVLLKEAGDTWHIAAVHEALGYVALLQGDYMRASVFYAQGLNLCRELGDRYLTEESLYGLAFVGCAECHYEKAARLFAVAETSHEILHSYRSAAYQAQIDQGIACARGGLGEKAFASAWAEGQAMTLEQAVGYALSPDYDAHAGRQTAQGR